MLTERGPWTKYDKLPTELRKDVNSGLYTLLSFNCYVFNIFKKEVIAASVHTG